MIAQSHTAFVSCSLKYEDRPTVDFFRDLLFANDIRPVTIGIDVPAKNEYEAARIAPDIVRACDCVVAIQSKRYQMIDGAYKPSEWTIEEPRMGIDSSKPLYVFHDADVSLKGAYTSIARFAVPFNEGALAAQRSQLDSHCSKIRDELSSMKSQGLLATIGTLAIVGGGLYLLYRLMSKE